MRASDPLSNKPADAIKVKDVGKGLTHKLTLGNTVNTFSNNLPLQPYSTTETGKAFPNALQSLPNDTLKGHNFRTCKSVMLFNGDVCQIGDWVLTAKGTAEQSLIVAYAILLECGRVGEPAAPYSMPAVRAHGGFLLYPVEQILCAANLQHQWQAHGCTGLASDIEFVYEEWTKTSKAKVAIHHIGDPDDLVLNTAHMRDAKHMQGLWVPIQPPDMNLAILEGGDSDA
ncbi:uncharacterized protein EDB93DRAFT_1257476 [Suillus bovinus]|uniref:uncharacterized protein n=1 Tax=Suillus bovinus TaxID=48563 RepID=UPI001B864967|nr:uncharacterized protein EDB93DRAFT_1257476 [Suillus bovinus]KAG2126565.1 hypothetical protein EDB93DRAFT_1257476 [Suillus bovinus]